MATEFITARFPDAEVPMTQTRARARRRVHRFIPPGSKARIREAGGDFGPWLPEAQAVDVALHARQQAPLEGHRRR